MCGARDAKFICEKTTESIWEELFIRAFENIDHVCECEKKHLKPIQITSFGRQYQPSLLKRRRWLRVVCSQPSPRCEQWWFREGLLVTR
jgi:hypothetical protein